MLVVAKHNILILILLFILKRDFLIDINLLISENAKLVDKQLKQYIPTIASEEYISSILNKPKYAYDNQAFTKSILNPFWYLLDLGGKRWRPTLMLLFIEALGKNSKDYLRFCIIPEVIHNATLVHDDIEDKSETRRGAPAVHIKYGIDVATNLGDFMQFFPMRIFSSDPKLSLEIKNKLFGCYIENLTRVTVGQGVDIAWHAGLINLENITEQNYLQMSTDKTGVLARLSCEFAGIFAEIDEKTIKTIGDFGAGIGVAFQIQDDILNIDESKVSESKGGVGDDITEGKISLMVIHTLKKASEGDKKSLLSILAEHTTDKEKISKAISILNKYDSIKYSKKIAQKIINEAWEKVEPVLKESKAKEQLKEFAEFMINRSR